MQSKQIKTDGTVYAYAEDYKWNPGRYGDHVQRAEPVIVKETGVSRKVHSGFGGYRSQNNDGVLIAFLDEAGNEVRTQVVQAKRIREEWATFKVRSDEQAKRRDERAREDAERKATTKARLDDAFRLAPKAKRPWWAEYDKGTMYASELADLMDAVYAAGVDAGREEAR